MPITPCTPVPETAQLMAAERSPSEMSLMRAPVARISLMSDSCRGRSRMTMVMSVTFRRSESAMRWTFSAGARLRSTWPAETGPTQIFSK